VAFQTLVIKHVSMAGRLQLLVLGIYATVEGVLGQQLEIVPRVEPLASTAVSGHQGRFIGSSSW